VNFRDLIPWPRATEYRKLSEEMYEVGKQIKQEQKAMKQLNEFSFSVGPSLSFEDGAAITFQQNNGLSTTFEMGYKNVKTLVDLLETVLANSKEQ